MNLSTLIRSPRNRHDGRPSARASALRRQPVLESMESRLALSAGAPAPAPPAVHAPPTPPAPAPLISISGISVQDVALSGNQLIANATINGKALGASFSLPIAIPVSLSAVPTTSTGTASPSAVTAAAASPTQLLNLTLGPVDLNLLGLGIHLGGSCTPGSTTPITAQIVAIPTGSTYTNGGVTYTGGLLGDVLSDVANLLNGGGALSGLGSELGSLESGLTNLLNGILGGLSGATGGLGGAAAPAAATPAAAPYHEVLEVPLGPLNLDLLGAYVNTSFICLNLTATPGPGNLLGNLLG